MICRTASPREASPLACVLFSLSAACAGFSASRAAKKRHHFTRSLLAKLASVCLLAGFGAVTTAAQSPQMASSGGVTAPFSVTRVYGGGTSYATSTPMAVTSWRGTYANQVITDSAGNIYISEYLGGNFCNVYEIVAATQKVMVIAGGGGALATTTPANGTSVVLVPYSLAIDGSGNLYIADYGLGFIEKMTGLNGSGTPQLIFQNGPLIGALSVGTNGLPTGWQGIGSLSSGWTLAYAVDLTYNGQPELIFQNGTLVAALQINTSLQPISWNGIGGLGSGWTLPGDY